MNNKQETTRKQETRDIRQETRNKKQPRKQETRDIRQDV